MKVSEKNYTFILAYRPEDCNAKPNYWKAVRLANLSHPAEFLMNYFVNGYNGLNYDRDTNRMVCTWDHILDKAKGAYCISYLYPALGELVRTGYLTKLGNRIYQVNNHMVKDIA